MDKEKIADWLHTLFCNKKHNYTPDDILRDSKNKSRNCNWYMDDIVEEVWEEPDHAFWIDIADTFDKLIQINKIEAKDFFKALCGLKKDYLKIIIIASAVIELAGKDKDNDC